MDSIYCKRLMSMKVRILMYDYSLCLCTLESLYV